jgi:hypothetical protein
MCKIFFSRSLKKTCYQRKHRQTECLLFNFLMIKLTKTQILPNFHVQNDFFWDKYKFYPLKIEKQTLSFSQFSLVTGFIGGNDRKYFTHILGQCPNKPNNCMLLLLMHTPYPSVLDF